MDLKNSDKSIFKCRVIRVDKEDGLSILVYRRWILWKICLLMIEFSSRDTIFKSFDQLHSIENIKWFSLKRQLQKCNAMMINLFLLMICQSMTIVTWYRRRWICNIVIYVRLRFKNNFIALSHFVFYKDIWITKKSY